MNHNLTIYQKYNLNFQKHGQAYVFYFFFLLCNYLKYFLFHFLAIHLLSFLNPVLIFEKMNIGNVQQFFFQPLCRIQLSLLQVQKKVLYQYFLRYIFQYCLDYFLNNLTIQSLCFQHQLFSKKME